MNRVVLYLPFLDLSKSVKSGQAVLVDKVSTSEHLTVLFAISQLVSSQIGEYIFRDKLGIYFFRFDDTQVSDH